jgi:hypothetical protein
LHKLGQLLYDPEVASLITLATTLVIPMAQRAQVAVCEQEVIWTCQCADPPCNGVFVVSGQRKIMSNVRTNTNRPTIENNTSTTFTLE